MKRLSLLLALAVLVTTIMIASALPAVAGNSGDHDRKPPTYSGNTGKSGKGGGVVIHRQGGGDDVFNKRGFVCNSCDD